MINFSFGFKFFPDFIINRYFIQYSGINIGKSYTARFVRFG